MRNIAKAPEPQSLAAHRAQANSTYGNYREKQALRESLVREQRGICCYCLCRIAPVELGMKIEHWRSQKHYPGDQLIYTNLLGACKGGEMPTPGEGRGIDRHCDTFKGDRNLSLNPAADDVQTTISYLKDGRIRSSDATFDAELSSVLNLNTYTMVNRRKAVINSFLLLLPKRQTMTKPDWEKVASDWDGEGHDSELREYSSVIVFWVRKYMLRQTVHGRTK